MLELSKEKSYTVKDKKLNLLFKQAIMYDKFKSLKFMCAEITCRPREHDTSIFVGLSNGHIFSLNFSKQKSLFYKSEDINLLLCKEEFKHKGPVHILMSEVIDGVSVLFSGGVDGTIKFWNTEEGQRESNYIATIFAHKTTVLAMAFSRSRNILVSSSTDMTIKVWLLKDNFDKILNPLFQCIATFKDFDYKKKVKDENPFWITCLDFKETDILELYAGDTTGRVHVYHYIDNTYLKTQDQKKNSLILNFTDEEAKDRYSMNNLNYQKTFSIHERTLIKLVHSIFDTVVYSVGFDNKIIGFNLKKNNDIFSLSNTNKTHYNCLSINYSTQELIIGDDKGFISFIKIYNKSESKIKAVNAKILIVLNIEIFPDQEHVLVLTDESLDIFRLKRDLKVSNVIYHEAEIIDLFVVEPINRDGKIIEDAK